MEDMPEYVRFEQAHTEDGNPFWQMVLKPRRKEEKKAAPEQISEDIRSLCLPSRLHPGDLPRKNHPSDETGRHRPADAEHRLSDGRPKKTHSEKDDTCMFPTGLKNKNGEDISVFFARNTRKNDDRPWALTRVYEGAPNPEDFSPTPAERANPGDALEISP